MTERQGTHWPGCATEGGPRHYDCLLREYEHLTASARPLFRRGDFALHSGSRSAWKIDCDALSGEDWEALAQMILEIVPPFGSVMGVPRGGLTLAECLSPYATQGPRLIVDDVLTTGQSMEGHRVSEADIGVVVFARGPCPSWVIPLFAMPPARAEAPMVRDLAEADRTIDEYEGKIEHLKQELAEVEQTLGQALGYPWYKDDPEHFPQATEADGVCVGEHTAATIAEEARAELEALRGVLTEAKAHVDELEEAWRRGVLREPAYDGGRRSNRNVAIARKLAGALSRHGHGGAENDAGPTGA